MADPKVVVVDYGMGNVLSVRRAFEHCGAAVVLTSDPDAIEKADRLVLPGVGAFGDCIAALESRGLVDPIKRFARSGRPFLGICVGMQILLDVGEEFGGFPGLGLIPGRVVQIDAGPLRKIPHIGWTPITPPPSANDNRWANSMFAETAPGTAFYFVHSFTARPENESDFLATADYAGASVTAAIGRDNIVGVQFHPEKSQTFGLALLERFLEWKP
jgi:glutamine amidotransferase